MVDATAVLHPDWELVEDRIASGIRRHRQGRCQLRLQDGAGRPIAGRRVAIRLHRLGCRFGCNTFMQGGYADAEEQAQWDAAFRQISNSAVVGCFWGDYEPEPGCYRFAADSPPRYRRPPLDQVLAWCQAQDLTPKLHNLQWSNLQPSWIAADDAAYLAQLRGWLAALAERYADAFPLVDVVNEILAYWYGCTRHRGFVPQVFRWARELFPQARLFVNETAVHSWQQDSREFSQLPLLIDWLRHRDAPFDGIGMQFHHFAQLDRIAATPLGQPCSILAVLDRMAGFGLPIDISEVTIPVLCDDGSENEELQAELTRRLYRLWFSHPAVDGIYWWNLADGHAFNDEARWAGGLLRADCSPKPAYRALDHLLGDEWSTCLAADSDRAGQVAFDGYFGRYTVTVADTTLAFDHRPGVAEISIALDGVAGSTA